MAYAVSLHERILTVKDTNQGHSRAPKTAYKRGTVKGTSSKSRSRFIRTLCKISVPRSPVFITLTYREFTSDFSQWKEHLDQFHRFLSYHFPYHCGVWRLEFQVRGAPHFHIIDWLGEDVGCDDLRARLSSAWCRIIGQETQANFEHGVDVEAVTDFRGTAFYLSAYLAKSDSSPGFLTGRTWGTWHKARLGLGPITSDTLSLGQFELFRRTLRRCYLSFCRSRGRPVGNYGRGLGKVAGFSSFMPYDQSKRLLEWCKLHGDRQRFESECRAELAANV